jgi:hypothetical protein
MPYDAKKQQELNKMVAKVMDDLRACEKFADEHKLGFSFSPAYGMGGYYNGDPEERYDPYGYGDEPPAWSPSSVGC